MNGAERASSSAWSGGADNRNKTTRLLYHQQHGATYSNGRASVQTTAATITTRRGGNNAFHNKASSSSSSVATRRPIAVVIYLLAVVYVGTSGHAFLGMRRHMQTSSSSSPAESSLESYLSTTDKSSSTSKSTATTTTTATAAAATTTTRKTTDHSSIHAAAHTATTSTATGTGTAGISSSGAVSASSSFSISSSFPLEENVKAAECLLQKEESKVRQANILTAYLEGPLHDTVPGTGSRGDVQHADRKGSDVGTPPDFILPLPLRTQSPNDLLVQQYPRLQTCHDLPAKFPVDRGLELVKVKRTNPETNQREEILGPVVWNAGDDVTPPTFVKDELPYCPIEKDPFLPWIHDVFPSIDGTSIEFIAQNKRRCRTGVKFDEHVNRLVPQVALMQGISVTRLNESEAQQLAPQLWSPRMSSTSSTSTQQQQTPRYRLVPIDEAVEDGQFTRFICRFHTTDYRSNTATEGEKILLGETLSQFPFNYELAMYRKVKANLLTPRGKDTRSFWASNIRFSCPVPAIASLQTSIATGTSLLSDSMPTLFVDVIPIRTSVRYSEVHMTEQMIGPKKNWRRAAFNATRAWGYANVVPHVEASGRWENIPICLPPQAPPVDVDNSDKVKEEKEKGPIAAAVNLTTKDEKNKDNNNKKKKMEKIHYLSACLWASAEFKTRGLNTQATTETLDRLQEWLEFHFLVGFDHVYVYDNSGAHTNTTNLKPLLSQYPASKVTWIDWPSTVCNNNIPGHDSTGERSSQYAAENSCRTRYAPYTTWIASFDTDEYFVPMGNHSSLRSMLHKAQDDGTNILSFRSSRGRMRMDKSYPTNDGIGSNDRRAQLPNAMYLEAYNCDSAGIPKPAWAERARKQIYQADYVLYHYVHYSTVTKGYMVTYQDHINAGHSAQSWSAIYRERPPSERAIDEVNEAVLVHTKTIKPDMTGGWTSRCKYDYQKKWQGCWVAFPWPNNNTKRNHHHHRHRRHNSTMISAPSMEAMGHDANGYEYNCFINEHVEQYWVPRLRAALEKRKKEILHPHH